MLAPSYYRDDAIVAMDRAYINYEKFEELTDRNVVYVTKMKKSLNYEVLEDCMDMQNFFNKPDADLKIMLEQASESPPEEHVSE